MKYRFEYMDQKIHIIHVHYSYLVCILSVPIQQCGTVIVRAQILTLNK